MLIVFKLTELSRRSSKRIIDTLELLYLNKTADRDSLYFYLKRVFKKILSIKTLVF